MFPHGDDTERDFWLCHLRVMFSELDSEKLQVKFCLTRVFFFYLKASVQMHLIPI